MAKNITVNGQSYTGKAAIKAQLTDGSGYATYVDASGVTAAAADVAAGKVIVGADGTEITGEASMGVDLGAVEVYVADFTAPGELTVTIGALDKYERVVMS